MTPLVLGEDGPTHQPVEHLAALRAIPNLNVFRPADIVENRGMLGGGIARPQPRQASSRFHGKTLPQLRRDADTENKSEKGAYVLRDAEDFAATLIATGSEVGLAVEAAEALAQEGIFIRVVSMPNWRGFEQQSVTYRESVLGDKTTHCD